MKYRFYLVLFSILLASCTNNKVADNGIIPQPNSIVEKTGTFGFDAGTLVFADSSSEVQRTAKDFVAFMKTNYGTELKMADKRPETNAVLFVLSEAKDTKEGAYKLTVSKDLVLVEAPSGRGLFYGLQTLKQILTPVEVSGLPAISCVEIIDEPSFEWRGFMLDVSRHFTPKDSIKKIIDILAMNKLNKFHWHLVDALGWRIQIDKYPELTDRGAWRVVKEGKKPWQDFETCYKDDSREVYGGFYTKDDIREIVKYASERYVDIIPEIEMPGHSQAALQCYPEYGCKGLQNAGVYCAGDDKSFEFLEDVLTEVMELFPYEYVHVGGDEVWKGNWKKCSACQVRMKREKLKDVNELQSYFIKRMEKFVAANGKKLIGWDEILEGGLPARATVMSWRGTKGGIEAANEGHDVVMTPNGPCYFDYKQSSNKFEPDSWGRFPNNVLKVYDFNPVPEKIAEDKKHHILGAQGNLWTEKVATFKHAQYMMLPRLSALAEALWTYPENKNRDLFRKKLDVQFDRFDELGYHYAESAFNPQIDTLFDKQSESMTLKLFNEIGMYDIKYTLDGSDPDINSQLFEKPIIFKDSLTLKARCFRKGKPAGLLLEKKL